MLLYLAVDCFPFIIFLARNFFPHPNKTRDVVQPRRLTGLRDFIETALGLFETAGILRAFPLSRTSDEWPREHRPNSRNEITSLHSSPQLWVKYDTTLVAECLKRRRRLIDNPLALVLSHDDGPLAFVQWVRGIKCRLRTPRKIRRTTTSAMSCRSGLAGLDLPPKETINPQ